MLLAFLIHREHLFWILSLSLAYRADMQIGRLASSRSGVFNIQNCPLDLLSCFELVLWYLNCVGFIKCYAQIFILYVIACWIIPMRYIQVKYFIYFYLLCTIPVLLHLINNMNCSYAVRACGYIDICRNVGCLPMKLVGAWWKEVFPQCVSASPSDFQWVVHVVRVFL